MTLFVQELQVPHPFFPAEHWRQTVQERWEEGCNQLVDISKFWCALSVARTGTPSANAKLKD